MKRVLMFTYINLKILMLDKLSFVWSLIMPIIMLVVSKNSIVSEKNLLFWWIYIIINSFIYGVGVYAMNMRGQGFLKTLFSIDNKPYEFFFANVLTQIIYSFICCTLLNLISVFVFSFDIIRMTLMVVVIIIVLIPIAFLSYNFTLFDNVNSNTVGIVINIVMFIMFYFMGEEPYRNFNPLFYYAELILRNEMKYWVVYFISHSLFIILSLKSIREYSPVVKWKR